MKMKIRSCNFNAFIYDHEFLLFIQMWLRLRPTAAHIEQWKKRNINYLFRSEIVRLKS